MLRARRLIGVSWVALAACATAASPGAAPVVIESTGGPASAAPMNSHAALPEHEPDLAGPDDPSLVAAVGELLARCRPQFVPAPTDLEADESFCAGLLEGYSMEDHPLKARTLLRLARHRDPEMAAAARFVLARYSPYLVSHSDILITPMGREERSGVCSDPALARRFFTFFEQRVGQPMTLADRYTMTELGSLAVCGDIDALGLLERVRAVGRAQMRRDIQDPQTTHDTVGIWFWAYVHNPRSDAMRQLFFEGFDAATPDIRSNLATPHLPSERPFNEPLCEHYFPYATGEDPGDARWAEWMFLSRNCRDHLDRYTGWLDARLRAHSTITAAPLRAAHQACRTQQIDDSGHLFDQLAPLVASTTVASEMRAQALDAACQCDRVRSRPLASPLRTSTDPRLREVAHSPSCR